MRVNVKELLPNPFRNMDIYPINRDKVESLKTSIKETSFWDNMIARPAKDTFFDHNFYNHILENSPQIIQETNFFFRPGENDGDSVRRPLFEIAYGHHRLIAIKELGIESIDIPIKDIPDADMIKIMANENMNDWVASPEVIRETVMVAKEFIEKHIKTTKTRSTAGNSCACSICNFYNKNPNQNPFNYKAGRTIINIFLGDNWKAWQIENALKIINNEDKIDQDIISEIPRPIYIKDVVDTFTKHEVPKHNQKEVLQRANEKINSQNVIVPQELGNINGNNKIKIALEQSIEEVRGIELQNTVIQQQKINKQKESFGQSIDINELMAKMNERMQWMNIYVSQMLNEWDHVNPKLKTEFIDGARDFLEILTRMKEQQWKVTKLQQP